MHQGFSNYLKQITKKTKSVNAINCDYKIHLQVVHIEGQTLERSHSFATVDLTFPDLTHISQIYDQTYISHITK